MATVLYLAHRLPFPPDKGDKVRTHHILRYLHTRHKVILGTFVDDPGDLGDAPAVARWCEQVKVVRLRPRWARLRSLVGLLRREPLSLAYYRDRKLRAWVRELRDSRTVDAVVVSSSSMAPYAEGFDVPVVMDFIDVDSAKWQAYAARASWPWSWIYGRESRLLLSFECQTAVKVTKSFFVTPREVDLFRRIAPGACASVGVLGNGVDTDHFCPAASRISPFPDGEVALVFTGTMSYRPNIDAVVWFACEVLPLLHQRWPTLRLTVVGRQPADEVRALEQHGVRVTGTVADVRPWLQHASVVVAPMRIARGIQNKILEAMAMARPVVAARDCAEAIDVVPGLHLAVAVDANDYQREIEALLSNAARASLMGQAARARMQGHYAWSKQLAPLDKCLGLM